MRPEQRNLMVGIFVLLGLLILAVLIIMFGELLQTMRPGYVIGVCLPNALRITSGKMVHKNGIIVGEVMDVQAEAEGVLIRLRISRDVDIPDDAKLIVSVASMGGVFLDIPVSPENKGKPVPKDNTAALAGLVKPFSLLPPDLTKGFKERLGRFDLLIDNLADLTAKRTPDEVAEHGANLSSVIHGLDAVINDPENQKNIKEGLAKIRSVAEKLNETVEEVQEFLDRASTFVDEASKTAKQWESTGSSFEKTAERVQQLIAKIEASTKTMDQMMNNASALIADVQKGKGTVGKLLTDDKLYNALWTTSENLSQTLDEARKLFILWRKQGVLSKED